MTETKVPDVLKLNIPKTSDSFNTPITPADTGSSWNIGEYNPLNDNISNQGSQPKDKWHYRFMGIASLVAGWSKDSTKVGAVAIDRDRNIISTGFNGFAQGIEDTIERLSDRVLKNEMVVHAEINCIINSCPKTLKRSTVYVYGVPPCTSCTAALIRSGIDSIVLIKEQVANTHEPWKSKWIISKEMFCEANITIISL